MEPVNDLFICAEKVQGAYWTPQPVSTRVLLCMGTQMEHGKTWKPRRGAQTGAGRDEGLRVRFPFLIHVGELSWELTHVLWGLCL